MAINKDKRVIHIRIGNLSFPIEIPCEKEEAFRHVERLVNEELSRYQERYRGQSMEKYMAMVLIDIGMKFFYSERRMIRSRLFRQWKSFHTSWRVH